MSTLVHIPDRRLDEALHAITALVGRGGPIAIGTWCGHDWEGISEHGDIRPYRFFSLRSHDRLPAAFECHAVVERFETYQPDPAVDWQYQFAVLRRP